MRRVGRPGLVGTMARTAVVAGTATAVSGRMHHRQQQRYADQEYEAAAQEQQAADAAAYREMQAQQAAPAAPAAPAVDTTAELQKLAELKASGALTDEEFAAAKAKLLA